MAEQIAGFDYVNGKPVSMTAAEWRAKFRPNLFDRAVCNGETWYRPSLVWQKPGVAHGLPRLAAEAYAIIPAGKAAT